MSSNQDHVLPLDAIATGDAPCLKRACLPCGGGEHQTMENINMGEMLTTGRASLKFTLACREVEENVVKSKVGETSS